jgi:hypothetical protein
VFTFNSPTQLDKLEIEEKETELPGNDKVNLTFEFYEGKACFDGQTRRPVPNLSQRTVP